MKKIIKNILLTLILTPTALLFLGMVAYLLYGLLAVGGESSVHQAYLKKHMESVRPGSGNQFRLFDSAFYQNKIFLLGEAHGFAMPQELDYELLKHLNQKAGVRHYLAEVDYSQAHFLNEYLSTGDEQLLRYVFGTWVRTNAQWGNKNFYEKIKRIRALNQTLPAGRKINIIGVDKIQDAAVTARLLRELRDKFSIPPSIATALDSLERLTSADNADLRKAGVLAGKLVAELGADTAYLLGTADNRFTLIHSLLNLTHLAHRVNRDSVMFLNLKAVTHALSLENEKMYGLWGFFHTLQIPMKQDRRVTPFAAHIKNEESPFKNKIVSLNIYVLDSDNMMPGKMVPPAIGKGKTYFNTTWANSDGPLIFVNGINDLKAVTEENSITIFDLATGGSPYQGSPRLAQVKVLIPGQNLTPDPAAGTDPAYQYVVLIRNSKSLEPLSK